MAAWLDWHKDKPTQNQLEYIKHIQESISVSPFTGKTKGEAAKWIDENRRLVYQNKQKGK